MVRQCAWCLCLIDNAGERLSPLPQPKLYEASHGICGICGVQWMEQVIEAEKSAEALTWQEVQAANGSGYPEVEVVRPESITQMVLQLQEKPSRVSNRSQSRRSTKMRIV
jgi:hypothetical protein